MLPSQHYQQYLQAHGFQADPLQCQVLGHLDTLHRQLVSPSRWPGKNPVKKGVYLWGMVGVGKSLLVDLFFESLPDTGKTRLHYQHFMAQVHRELNTITGQANPLQIVGKRLAAQFQLICLDELHLTDLGDAMIVQQLFDSLFQAGVVLVITSNFAPQRLFRDDLQPKIFEPAISLIKANTLELHLAGTVDYRQIPAPLWQTWYTRAELSFELLFDRLNQEINASSGFSTVPLTIQQHALQPVRYNGTLVWFSFAELCELPRSARDYIALGKQFKIFLLGDIPQFGNSEALVQLASGTEDATPSIARLQYSDNENAQRRFINLVDELYDQGIKLYLQAAVPLAHLYTGGKLAFEFQRTISRLSEMQSLSYQNKQLRS